MGDRKLDKFAFQDQLRNATSDAKTGFVRGEVKATRSGVFEYPGRGVDGASMFLLRHPDEVHDPVSIATAFLKPITLWHPPEDLAPDGFVDVENIDQIDHVGTLGETYRIEGKDVVLSFAINEPEGIGAIKSGLNAFSMVHSGRIVYEPGVYHDPETGLDTAYTHREYDIFYNSGALVDRGRAGPQAQIFLDRAEPEGAYRMELTKIINGITYKGDAEIVKALEAAESQLAAQPKALSDALDPVTAQRDKLDGELAAEKLKTKALQDKLDSLPAELKKNAEARAKVTGKAKKMGMSDSDMDAMADATDVDLMKKAILADNPEAMLEGKSDDYIRGLFDAIEVENEDDEDPNGTYSDKAEKKALADKAEDEYIDPIRAAALRAEADANLWKTPA